jgi:2-dehydropantoate 2-reductase
MGGYFGGRLAEAGADVTFLVRPRRAEQLRRCGLMVASPVGDIHQTVAVITRDELDCAYELILLSCKAYDLGSAIESIRPAVGPATQVLPVLNGLSHLDDLDAAFGPLRVMGGLASVTLTLTPEGVVQHLRPFHLFIFGPRAPSQQAVCEAFLPLCSGFDAKLSDSILLDMWEKLVLIAALAGTTCLMRSSLCDFLKLSGGEALMVAMIGEGSRVAEAAGYPPRPASLSLMRSLLTDRDSTMAASMLRDIEAGRQTEADHILGDLLRRGAEAGIDTPLLALAYLHLQAYAARRDREAGTTA